MTVATASEVEVLSRPTTGDIIWARLHLYFGSRYVHAMLAASLLLPVVLYAMTGEVDTLGVQAVAMAWLILPFATAISGIRSKRVRDITHYGIRYRLSSAGVAWQYEMPRASASGQHDWSHFNRAKETRDAFLLFAGLVAVVLPKRALAEGHEARLRELVRHGVKGALLKRSAGGPAT